MRTDGICRYALASSQELKAQVQDKVLALKERGPLPSSWRAVNIIESMGFWRGGLPRQPEISALS